MTINHKITTILTFSLIFFLAFQGFSQSKKEEKQISRLLIIVLVGNQENRQTFEDEIQIQLAVKGYASIQSHKTALNTGEKITREEVISVVEENNYDGVLLLKLLDADQEVNYTTSDKYDYSGDVYFYNYAYSYFPRNWDSVKEIKIVIESDLFYAGDKSLVFSDLSNKIVTDNAEEFIGKFSKKLVNKLIKGKYLKKNE